MLSRAVVIGFLVVGCGGDDDGAMASCTVTVTGDVSATDSCGVYLCYPRDSTYEALLLSPSDTVAYPYDLSVEVDDPTSFTAGQMYTLDDTLRMDSMFQLTAEGKTYRARAGAVTRDPSETARLHVGTVTPPSGDEACNGHIRGLLIATMVEIIGSGSGQTVGPGRVRLEALLGQP